jgi:predicted nucleotidyltransferase
MQREGLENCYLLRLLILTSYAHFPILSGCPYDCCLDQHRNELDMGNKHLKIEIPNDRIASFCRRHHIRRLSLFGSALRDDFGPNSDIDVLVEFEPGKTPSFFRLFDMEDELSAMLEGRKVDVRTPEDLGRYFRQRVLSEALVQYAA